MRKTKTIIYIIEKNESVKFDILEEELEDLFDVCISEKDDSEYNSEYDYESNIYYKRPEDFTFFFQYLEEKGIIEDIKERYDTLEEIYDYFQDIINDNLYDFCEKEIIEPYWVENIKSKLIDDFDENSDFCPLCNREIHKNEW